MDNSSLHYAFVNKYSPIPPRALNGGLYTGEPFHKGASYGNVPVIPCASYWAHENLMRANPPIQALYQIQNPYRPGNNTDPELPGMSMIKDPILTACIPTKSVCQENDCDVKDSCETKVIYV